MAGSLTSSAPTKDRIHNETPMIRGEPLRLPGLSDIDSHLLLLQKIFRADYWVNGDRARTNSTGQFKSSPAISDGRIETNALQ